MMATCWDDGYDTNLVYSPQVYIPTLIILVALEKIRFPLHKIWDLNCLCGFPPSIESFREPPSMQQHNENT
jgi:hypothetical protein